MRARPSSIVAVQTVDRVLSLAALLGSGTTAGVLFCVALSIVPAFLALPPDRYVHTHKLIGRNYDKVMPVIVLGSCAVDLALTVTAPAAGALFGAAAVLLLGVSAVSHLANVPINRRVKGLDPAAIPDDWPDPRRPWRNWNLLRTVLALLSFAVNGAAVVLQP